MKRVAVVVAMGLAGTAWVRQAAAQVVIERAFYGVTLEAFGNVTAARPVGGDTGSIEGLDLRLDGAVRLISLVKTGSGFSFGPRVVVQTTPQDKVGFAERSLLFLGRWGRIEVGNRQGLPDVLIGYAPNNFTFTGAEFGPATGPGLDPDGRLPTAYLTPALAAQIDGLSSLGFAASLYGDESRKFIYVLPKKKGFLGGVSFAPRVDRRNGSYRELLQSGLTYEFYTKRDVFRLGASYTYAHGARAAAGGDVMGDLHSVSGGATTTLSDRLVLGVSFTYNGDTGLARRPGPTFQSAAFGYAASVNYNLGPWTVGGYYQRSRSQGDTAVLGADLLRAVELGASYRFNRRVRIYGAAYLYGFRNEGGRAPGDRFDGAVVLVGLRAAI